jgi:hypothetical protein
MILSTGVSSFTFAQSDSLSAKTPSIWIQAGPTITTLGLGYNGSINAQIQDHYFALKTNSTELSIWEETWDISLIYGRHAQINQFNFYAGTGFSVLGGTSYTSLFETSTQEDFSPVMGFPLEGSVYWHPMRSVGIGLNAFANVNTVQPFGGVGITLRAGYFNSTF